MYLLVFEYIFSSSQPPPPSSSSSSKRAVLPPVDPFRSHTSRNLSPLVSSVFWSVAFSVFSVNYYWGIMFTYCNQFLFYSYILSTNCSCIYFFCNLCLFYNLSKCILLFFSYISSLLLFFFLRLLI